jgi:[ribosomal protein S18]-alanine N-acetyltransferase
VTSAGSAPRSAVPAGRHPGDSRLRAMTPADLPGVIALEHELFPDDPWTPEMFADELAQPPETRLYLLAEAPPSVGRADVSPAADGAAADGPAEDRTADAGAAASGRQPAGQPVMAGYAGMMFIPDGTQADVLTIAVRPAHWGQGIGSALLGTLLATARDRGCTEVFLEVRADNPRAHGLYLRRGFTELGLRRGYYQPSGVDAIVMRKDLLR